MEIVKRDRTIKTIFTPEEVESYQKEELAMIVEKNWDGLLEFWKAKRREFIKRSVDLFFEM